MVAVIGVNDAGKTTLLRTISNIVKPSSGRILFKGTSTEAIAPHVLARMGTVHVPQGRQIVPTIGRKELERNLEREFERFPVLRSRQNLLRVTCSAASSKCSLSAGH